MDDLDKLTERIDRLNYQHRKNSTLIAAALMLGLGVKDTEIPAVMARLDKVQIPESPDAVFDAVKLAILEVENGLPPSDAVADVA